MKEIYEVKRAASSWLRKVVPAYSVMAGVCSGPRVWGAMPVAHQCSAVAVSSLSGKISVQG